MLKNKALFVTIFTVGFPLFCQLIYLRYVSYEVDRITYGNFILLTTFVYGISQIFMSVPGQAFARFFNSTHDKVYFINEFRTYLLIINIISLGVFYGYYLIYAERFSGIVYVLSFVFYVVFNNFTLNQSVFLLNLDRNKFFYFKVLEAISKFILPLFTYAVYETLESFIAGITLGYVFSFFCLSVFLKGVPFRLEFNLNNFKTYFIFAYPIMISAIFNWSISFSDRYFIDYYRSIEEVAIYSVLAQLAGFFQVLAMIYSMYVNPLVLKRYNEDKKEGIKLLNRYLRYFALVLIISFLIISALPNGVFSLVIEKKVILDHYVTFIILSLGVMLVVFQTAASMYLVLLKKLHVHAKIFMLAAILNIALNFFIIEYGIIAAAVSTFVAYLTLNGLLFLWIKYRLIKSI